MRKSEMTSEEAVLRLREQKDMQSLVRDCYFDDPIDECAERYYNSLEWKEIWKILCNIRNGKALDISAGRRITSYALVKDG